MKDSVSKWAELIATVITGVALAITDAVVARRLNHVTLRTGRKVAVLSLKHEVKAGVIVRELLVQGADGVARNFHYLQCSSSVP